MTATAGMLTRNGVPIDRSASGIDIDPAEAVGVRIRIVPVWTGPVRP